MPEFLEILKAILIGIVEGITEWLPISSTGHMLLLDEYITLNVSADFKEMFLVVIQLGAILAVPILFFEKLNPFSKKKSEVQRRTTLSVWLKVLVGALPAAVIGLLIDDILEKYLMTPIVVAVALIAYGVGFIIVEKIKGNQNKNGKIYRVEDVAALSYKDALLIGSFQVISLIPGTSRSGSTILGGLIIGVSRVAAAEFSFFMAIPIMLGASGYKLLKFIVGGALVNGLEVALLLIGMAVAFFVSLASIKFLMDFVKKHSFSAFGIYRIVLGVIVVVNFVIRALV